MSTLERYVSLKCVVVGDGAVGKTSLLMTYTLNGYDESYIPTVFDNYTCNVVVDETIITLNLWDTAGQEDYDHLRPLSYPNSDCFLLCYSVISPISLANVTHKWLPEIRHFCPSTNIVLAGTKVDCRTDSQYVQTMHQRNITAVSTSQGQDVCTKNGLQGFVECSAKNNYNVKQLFDTVVRSVLAQRLKPQRVRRRSCVLV